MHLVQVLLPLLDNSRDPIAEAEFARVRDELTTRFGGLTAYTRAPAEGLWKQAPDSTARDEIVLLEIMAEDLDRGWWASYRADLEARFGQEEIVVRAQEIERL